MKKVLAILLAAAMLLSLAACGDKQSANGDADPTVTPTATESEPPEATDEPEPSEVAEDEEPALPSDQVLGVYSEDTKTYENEFNGIGCRLDEDWEVFDADQLAELNNMMVDMMTDEDIAEQLENSGYLQPFYAQADDGLVTVNVTLENLGVLYGTLLDEQGYAEKAIDQLSAALEGLGLTNITSEISSTTFAGSEHAAINISGSYLAI